MNEDKKRIILTVRGNSKHSLTYDKVPRGTSFKKNR